MSESAWLAVAAIVWVVLLAWAIVVTGGDE